MECVIMTTKHERHISYILENDEKSRRDRK